MASKPPQTQHTSPLYTLPNELLLAILSTFRTPTLLPWTLTSRRFASLICRLIRTRMHTLCTSKAHTLLLELYPPSGKYSEPHLYCTPLGTPGLDDTLWLPDVAYPDTHERPFASQLHAMRHLYTSFVPRREMSDSSQPKPRHPAGDVPGSRTHPATADKPQRYAATEAEMQETVRKVLHLDSHELFTQLCASIQLIQLGPRKGVYTSCVLVEEGFTRLFRRWLGERCVRGRGVTEVEPRALHTLDVSGDPDITWLGLNKTIGFRFGVAEKDIWREPRVVLLPGEDPPVSYEVEYRELLVQTSKLLLKFEQSFMQSENNTNKAVVFGQFEASNS
ncbi:hypothetical protein EJ05DRAFT_23955 [Pseudovirgaria hyperparasitica]|uniref:F-box domain-containing protein n=1 Tax=Pseudovirgaria hyperparasitica TaxID=470096 RepID=A0A6A6WLH9_9PEZI|nr:uncharacterized protein EJ05DRAFT_23955 [Pseudovirgaria hyperparasitica]KAF2763041.1 hypothetical protein EJ05DRAFT_23955 [Pseudovirgaria hyperparasitica]